MMLTQQCFICQKIMQKPEIRMLCLQCKDCCLCMDCYSINLEWKNHKPTHQQIPINECDEYMFSNGFSIYETIVFLHHIRNYGFGSWQTIKNQIKRPINVPLEQIIYDFYALYELYLQLIEQQFSSQSKFKDMKSLYEINNLINLHNQIHLKQKEINLASNPQSSQLPKYDIHDHLSSNTGEGDGKKYFLGSWPLREEVSYEHINKAEYPLMYMRIKGNESKQLLGLKIQVIQSYVFRLIRRHNFKILCLKYGLHRIDGNNIDDISKYYDSTYYNDLTGVHYDTFRNHQQLILQLSPIISEKDINDNCQANKQLNEKQIDKYEQSHLYLARGFTTRKDFRTYIANLLYEKELRIKIYELQNELQNTNNQLNPNINRDQGRFQKLKDIINQQYYQIRHTNFQNVPLQCQLEEIVRNFRIPGDMINFMKLLEVPIISPGNQNNYQQSQYCNQMNENNKYIIAILQHLLKAQLNDKGCIASQISDGITQCYCSYFLSLKNNMFKYKKQYLSQLQYNNKLIGDKVANNNSVIFQLITFIYDNIYEFETEIQNIVFNISYSGCFMMVGFHIALINLCTFIHTLKQLQNQYLYNKNEKILETSGNFDILKRVIGYLYGSNSDIFSIVNSQQILLNIFNGINPVLNSRYSLVPIHELQQHLIDQLNCSQMTVQAFIQKYCKKQDNYIHVFQHQQLNGMLTNTQENNGYKYLNGYQFSQNLYANTQIKNYILRPIQLVSIIQYILTIQSVSKYQEILDMLMPQLLGAFWPSNPLLSIEVFNILRQNRYSGQLKVSQENREYVYQQQLEFLITQVNKYQLQKNQILLFGTGILKTQSNVSFIGLQDFINVNLSQYFVNYIHDNQFLDWFMVNPLSHSQARRSLPIYFSFLNDKKQRCFLDDYKQCFGSDKYFEKRSQILLQSQYVTSIMQQDQYYSLVSFLNTLANFTDKSTESIDIIIHNLKNNSQMLQIFKKFIQNNKTPIRDSFEISVSDSKVSKQYQVSITLQEIIFTVIINISIQQYLHYKHIFYSSGCIITPYLYNWLNENTYLNEAISLIILTYDSQSKQKITKLSQNKNILSEKDFYVNMLTTDNLKIITYTQLFHNKQVKEIDNQVQFYEQLIIKLNEYLGENQYLTLALPSLSNLQNIYSQSITKQYEDLFPSSGAI